MTLFDRAQLPTLRADLPSAVFYYSNWWFIFQHVSYFARFGQPAPVGHLWSLAIEEQFYLLWPIVVFLGLRWVRSRRTLVVSLLIAAVGSAVEMGLLYVPFQDPTRVYDGTDTRAFALLIGAVLALLWPRDLQAGNVTRGARRLLECVGGIALVGIFALIAATNEYMPFLYRGGIFLAALLTAALIAVTVHPGTRLNALLGIGPLRWIGRRSYGIYLWHYPIIVLTTPLNAPPNLVRITLQIAASLTLAGLSWRYLEEPIRHGAIQRYWSRLRALHWSTPRPSPFVYGVSVAVLANGVICTVGLVGLVGVPAAGPLSQIKNIVPVFAPQPTTSTAGSVSTTVKPPSRLVTATTVPPPPAGAGVTAIGDSIMIDAAPYLKKQLPGIVIDAQIGQQLYQLLPEVPKLKSEGVIGDRVIIELGTNGSYSKAQLVQLLNSLGPPREIVLVNTLVPRPWEEEVNQTIAAVAESYPHVTVVDWHTIGALHRSYFYPDGVHPDPEGASFYASLLVKALDSAAPCATVKDRQSEPKTNERTPTPTTNRRSLHLALSR